MTGQEKSGKSGENHTLYSLATTHHHSVRLLHAVHKTRRQTFRGHALKHTRTQLLRNNFSFAPDNNLMIIDEINHLTQFWYYSSKSGPNKAFTTATSVATNFIGDRSRRN